MTMFKYVFIPADTSLDIEQRSASKDGGLENDALRRSAEEHFEESPDEIDHLSEKRATADALVQQGVDSSKISEIMETIGGKRIGSNVEIVTVAVANDANKFIGVSMYSDGHIAFKPKASINKRATKLLRNCGHDADVKGDAFVGRAFDDEREEWVRLDFLLSDLDENESWISSTKVANTGRNMGAYRTSGAMKKIIQPGGESDSIDTSLQSGASVDNSFLSWNQTADEVELRFELAIDLSAKQLAVVISSTTVCITLKSGESLATVGPKFQAQGGALLFGRIVKDDSSWSVSVEGNMKVLCLTLIKADSSNWKSILQS